MITESYSPLANGPGSLDDPALVAIAEAHGKSVPQVDPALARVQPGLRRDPQDRCAASG